MQHCFVGMTFRKNSFHNVVGIKSFAKYIARKWPISLTRYHFFKKVLRKKLNYMTARQPCDLQLQLFKSVESCFFNKGYGASVITS